MDDIIYSKLPSGGSLWEYKSDYSNKYVQKYYDNLNSDNPIYKINTIIKTNRDKTRKKTLMNFIINTIDPLASLYTSKMYEQAENIFKDKLVDIISKGPIYQWLGPKKSRSLLSWITHNNHGVIDDIGKIVADFLSWFLNKSLKYIPENTKEIVDSSETGVTYITYENKTYIIKN